MITYLSYAARKYAKNMTNGNFMDGLSTNLPCHIYIEALVNIRAQRFKICWRLHDYLFDFSQKHEKLLENSATTFYSGRVILIDHQDLEGPFPCMLLLSTQKKIARFLQEILLQRYKDSKYNFAWLCKRKFSSSFDCHRILELDLMTIQELESIHQNSEVNSH